jgi:uncharacterized protein (DUF433 family)
MLERITHTPGVMNGKACIRGMRVTVAQILRMVAVGMTTEQILTDYPYLEADDIKQALAFAAWRFEEQSEPLPA